MLAVLASLPLSKANNEDSNTSSNTVPAKHTDLNKDQIIFQKLQELRQELWKRSLWMPHGPVKDGLAAFLMCERKKFKIGEPIPIMVGIVYGGTEKYMTVVKPISVTGSPGNLSWLSITGPDGRDVPYTGDFIHFLPPKCEPESEWEVRLTARRFCGISVDDIRSAPYPWGPDRWLPDRYGDMDRDGHKLDTPGSYTIKWHYSIAGMFTCLGWQGHLVSNEIQIEIVP